MKIKSYLSFAVAVAVIAASVVSLLVMPGYSLASLWRDVVITPDAGLLLVAFCLAAFVSLSTGIHSLPRLRSFIAAFIGTDRNSDEPLDSVALKC